MKGFFLVHRGWRDNPVFRNEPFSRGDAWLWLIENAAWQATRIRVSGAYITLERGQLSFSIRFMADAWGWSKSRVARYLDELQSETMIGTSGGTGKATGQLIITICNYDKYQVTPEYAEAQNGTERGTNIGTTLGQQRDNSGTKKKEVKESNKDSPPSGGNPAEQDFFEIPEFAKRTATPPFPALSKLPTESGQRTYPAEFEAFWRSWFANPNDTKASAYRAWAKAVGRNKAMIAKLRGAAEAEFHAAKASGTEARFRPHVQTWCNREGWTAAKVNERNGDADGATLPGLVLRNGRWFCKFTGIPADRDRIEAAKAKAKETPATTGTTVANNPQRITHAK